MTWKRTMTGLLWISPWLIGFACFTVLPLVLGVWYSMTDWTLLEAPVAVGMEHYTRMLHDEVVHAATRNTLVYIVITIPLLTVVSIALAMLLSRPARFIAFWRVAVFAPSVLPLVALATIFKLMYDGELGVINRGLEATGLRGPGWFTDETWAMVAIILMNLWVVGPAMVIYLASLRDVPRDLHEAASIDGVGWWGRLVHVTLPMISPVILFNVIIGLVNAAQVFVVPYIMTGGGPNRATYFWSMYVYDAAFRYGDMGYASALGVVQFLAILLLTIGLLLIGRRFVFYRGAVS
tara:strand:+ start:1943 stop:2821 length:879 start_codon:yes stop_codon:yes gene_type:complete